MPSFQELARFGVARRVGRHPNCQPVGPHAATTECPSDGSSNGGCQGHSPFGNSTQLALSGRRRYLASRGSQSCAAPLVTILPCAHFNGGGAPIEIAEVYPSLLADEVRADQGADEILDAAQVRILAERLAHIPPDSLAAMLDEGDPIEGWILGLGREAKLRAAGRTKRAAMPAGVDWMPVPTAMKKLRATLTPIDRVERVDLSAADGRILAEDLAAKRANPPTANAAVDGYGFASASIPDGNRFALVAGRAAAGRPFSGAVPPGHAVRILTGAVLPDGVDSIALQEDATVSDGAVQFSHLPKPGANTRPAGEDKHLGDPLFDAGHRLRPADLALLAATGWGTVPVRAPLRVAVMSTGDEIVEATASLSEGQIADANRPMLLAMLRRWGYAPIDLGVAPDDGQAVTDALDRGAASADAIFVSGGASSGDEDHVARLLVQHGNLQAWRIAMKPGRPLTLAHWSGVPVIGLPGNPVAAFVCALVFGAPALSQLAGAGWQSPAPQTRIAAFQKSKHQGPSRVSAGSTRRARAS